MSETSNTEHRDANKMTPHKSLVVSNLTAWRRQYDVTLPETGNLITPSRGTAASGNITPSP